MITPRILDNNAFADCDIKRSGNDGPTGSLESISSFNCRFNFDIRFIPVIKLTEYDFGNTITKSQPCVSLIPPDELVSQLIAIKLQRSLQVIY